MNVLTPPRKFNKKCSVPSKAWRNYHAAKATALDADKYPILAKHWPGLLIVNGKLACNDGAPVINRFKAEQAGFVIAEVRS